MIRLSKYLKPFLSGLIIALVLLFVQAICDLNLPNYMSEIVNVGIQQNGIENVAPEAISRESLSALMALMTENEKVSVYNHYLKVSPKDETDQYHQYKQEYPKAKDDFYILKSTDDHSLQELNEIFTKSSFTAIQLLMGQTSQKNGERLQHQSPKQLHQNVDENKIYQLLPSLEQLPKDNIARARHVATTADAAMMKQSGLLFTKSFYRELGRDIEALQKKYIIHIGLIMMFFALFGGLATVMVSYLASKISTGVARNLRKDVFNQIESFSSKEFDAFGVASLITRCTNDIAQIQQLLQMGIRMVCYAPIMGIGGVIMAVKKAPSMSWILALAVIAVIAMVMVLLSLTMPKFRIIQSLIDRLNIVARENLSGLMVIRAFGTKTYEKKRFAKANEDLIETNLIVSRMMSLMMPTMMIIMNGLTLFIIWFGAHRIAESTMQVGDMMAYMQYAMQVLMAFMMLSMIFILLPRAAVSGTRIAEVLDTPLAIVDPLSPQTFHHEQKGVLAFEEVSFHYDGAEKNALNHISFIAKPGETTAIIGATGSGKSTIASLALRFYDVGKGRICLDGVDIREVRQQDLRNKIGYVPQLSMLLSGSISFNLKYSNKEISDDTMTQAAKVAQANDFIEKMPEGYESALAQGGSNMSGGQKQRLSIARALAKLPDVLIFDDSFSALDAKTDAQLRQALSRHTDSSTIIIIAQRISSILHANQILVLDKGSIVGRGTHQELLNTCPEYREIARSQAGGEELI